MSIRDGCFLTAGLALVDQTFVNRLNDVYSASGIDHLRKVYMYPMTLNCIHLADKCTGT